MLTVEHWAILGQTLVLLFAILGIGIVGYLVNKEISR